LNIKVSRAHRKNKLLNSERKGARRSGSIDLRGALAVSVVIANVCKRLLNDGRAVERS
jgi:hypothetical protein